MIIDSFNKSSDIFDPQPIKCWIFDKRKKEYYIFT